jgi:hypothetical protein
LAQRLAHTIGGEIRVENGRPGGTFSLRLPLA